MLMMHQLRICSQREPNTFGGQIVFTSTVVREALTIGPCKPFTISTYIKRGPPRKLVENYCSAGINPDQNRESDYEYNATEGSPNSPPKDADTASQLTQDINEPP
jgi:hypothetical protein